MYVIYVFCFCSFLPLSTIIDSHCITHHSFADNWQLPMSATFGKIAKIFNSMQSCMSDINAWAIANILILNGNKTELRLVAS